MLVAVKKGRASDLVHVVKNEMTDEESRSECADLEADGRPYVLWPDRETLATWLRFCPGS